MSNYGHGHGPGGYHRGGYFRGRGGRGGAWLRRGRRWQFLHPGGVSMPDPQVSWAQSCLAQSVDPSVPQDGVMGPQTRQAIRTFQMQQQLPPRGILDPDTVTALQAACSGASAGQQPPAPPPPPPPPPPPQQPAPPTGSQHSHQQQEAFLGDIVGGVLGGPLFGLLGGHDGQQPPPPPEDRDSWRWRRHRHEGWRHETEGEFPFEFRHHDFFRDRDRWREDHDRRWPWLFQEGEVGTERPAAGTEKVPTPRPTFRPEVPTEQAASRPAVPTGRPTFRPEIPAAQPVFRPEIPAAQPVFRPEPRPERPLFRPEFWSNRPSFRAPYEFHPREGVLPYRDGWHWDRGRRWFQRPWERRGWGLGVPMDTAQILWAQSCLAQVLGPWVIQDGVMGPGTHGALRTFQQQQQLLPSGVLDGNTVNALQALCGSQMPPL